LEHHESSWNGVDTETLASTAACRKYAGDLLAHEFVHSWNGKYRRPAGLVRSDYQADETTDLLWVYEGLTEYYSDVLAVRAGFWTPADYRAALAAKYAALDVQTGRMTRTLEDTTFDERLRLGAAPHATFAAARRSAEDYYDEGELMWLDADTLIRERSHGRRSLDDFARTFFGVGGDTAPAVLPYTRADVVAALDAIEPNDWERFFHDRLDVPTPHPPSDGLTRGGYVLRFAATASPPNPSTRVGGGTHDYRYDLGASISATGAVTDVQPDSPAGRAGLVPGMSIVAIDGRRLSVDDVVAAITRDAISKAPMSLLVTNHQAFATLTLAYTGGVRVPTLVRSGGPDLIAAILHAR
jgi:predicted metalloprotease with PDZ domain